MKHLELLLESQKRRLAFLENMVGDFPTNYFKGAIDEVKHQIELTETVIKALSF